MIILPILLGFSNDESPDSIYHMTSSMATPRIFPCRPGINYLYCFFYKPDLFIKNADTKLIVQITF